MKKLMSLILIVMISIVTPVAESTQNSFVEFTASMNTLQVEIDCNYIASMTNPAVADTTGNTAETLSANGFTSRNSINPAMAVSIGVESAVRRITRAKKRAQAHHFLCSSVEVCPNQHVDSIPQTNGSVNYIKEENQMKYAQIMELVSAVLTNHNTLANFIAYFGGEDHFQEGRLARYVDFNPEKLELIKGIGNKTAAKLVSALEGKLDYKSSTVKKAIEEGKVRELIQRLTLKTFDSKEENKAPILDKMVKRNGEDIPDIVSVAYSDVTAKLAELNGGEPVERLFTVSRITTFDSAKKNEAQMMWNNIIEGGLMYKNRLYKPYGHGTNNAKKSKVNWAPSELVEALRDWMWCGAHKDAVFTDAKAAAYMGLNEPKKTAFGGRLDEFIIPENIAMLSGAAERMIECDYKIASDTDVSEVKHGKVNCKFGDGQLMIHFSEKMKAKIYSLCRTDEEFIETAMALASLKDFTIRGPWTKGLAIANFDFHTWCHDHGIHTLPDGRDIDDVCILMDNTVFKAKVGGNGCAYDDWHEFAAAFHAYGHRYGKLLEEHPAGKHNLPYQQLQTNSCVNDKLVIMGAQKDVKKLNNMRYIKNAHRMYNGAERVLVKMHPEAAEQVRYLRDAAAQKYRTYRKESLSGEAHAVTQYQFLTADPIAMLETWFGMDVKGCGLKPNQALTSCGLTGEGVITRNPCPSAQSQSIVEFVGIEALGDNAKYFTESNSIMVSCDGTVLQKADADCDGDGTEATTEKWYVDLVKETLSITGDYVVIWNAPSAEKHVITYESFCQYVKTLTVADKLGEYCDNLGISIADIMEAVVNGDPDAYKAVDWIKMAINILVDASKHGGKSIKLPYFVLKFLRWDPADYQTKKPIPRAIANYKMLKGKFVKNYAAQYGNNAADVFADYIDRNTSAEFAFADSTFKNFDYRCLLVNPNHVGHAVSGLLEGGTKDKNGKYVNRGKWVELCDKTYKEWKRESEEEDYVDAENFFEWREAKVVEWLTAYAEKRGVTFDDIYDTIIVWLFNDVDKMIKVNSANPTGFVDILWKTTFDLLRGKIIDTLLANKDRVIEVKPYVI